MHHVRVALDDRVVRHGDRARHADAAEVVAGEVDEHEVLGALLGVGEELRLQAAVGGLVGAAGAGAGDGADLAATFRQAHVHLGGGAYDVEPAARLDHEHVRGRVHVPEHAVEVERIAHEGDVGAARQHDLHAVAGADVFLRAADVRLEGGLGDVGLPLGELGGGG